MTIFPLIRNFESSSNQNSVYIKNPNVKWFSNKLQNKLLSDLQIFQGIAKDLLDTVKAKKGRRHV